MLKFAVRVEHRSTGALYVDTFAKRDGGKGMNWQEIEHKLPTMNQGQLVDSLKICLRLIERMERELVDGARKMDEMTALLQTLSKGKSVDEGT